jgi:outer membrane lipase/esterase
MKLFTNRTGRKALALTVALALAPLASAGSFSSVISFGDSLSDTGNISFATGGFPPPPYTPGRFTSNFQDGTPGQVWVEHVSAHFGASSVSTLNGGTNYAWGGSRIGPDNAGFPPSLLDQHNFYLNDASGMADPNALYTVFGGGNDVIAGATGDSVAGVSTIINNLADAGGKFFFVPNLPDIGMTPQGLDDAATGAALSVLTMDFNDELSLALDAIEQARDITIIRFDLFSLFNDVIADPMAFGLTNVADRCFDEGAGTLCNDVDSYLFFDGIHPTAQGHALVAGYAIDAIEAALVPLPAALPLLLAGLGVLGLVRRRA